MTTGGFPLTSKTFSFLQNTYQVSLAALGSLWGDRPTIIGGMEIDNGQVGAGILLYNGEVLPFEASAENETVSIIETVENVEYNEGDEFGLTQKPGYITRIAICGENLSNETFAFADLVTPDYHQKKHWAGMPQMWSGAIDALPKYFQLCDGTNGTPNLRDRFIVGAGGEYNVGDTGGEKEHTLTEAEMPIHNHSGRTTENGSHSHTMNTREGTMVGDQSIRAGGGAPHDDTYRIDLAVSQNNETSQAGSHQHTIPGQGADRPHENRPPYYALAYIMFVG